MKKIFFTISAFVLSLTPICGAVILGLVAYISFENVLRIIIPAILGLLSIWAAYKIFVHVRRVGPIDFLTNLTASPDLDNLKKVDKQDKNVHR